MRFSSTPPAPGWWSATRCLTGCARAAIDVYEAEPLPADDPWRAAAEEFGDRLLLSPHLGYVTQSTWDLFYRDTVEDIRAWAEGAPIRTL